MAGGDPARAQAIMRRMQARRDKARQGEERREGGGAPHGEVVEAEADEMSMVEVDGKDIQAVRERLIERLDDAERMGALARDRFQSVLRQRDAEPVLEKGFGETAKATAIDWFVDKVKDGVKDVFEAGEVALGPAEKSVSFARESLGGITEAGQAEAKVAAVDRLVNDTRHAFQRATDAGKAAVAKGQPMDLFKADAAAEERGPIITSGDVDELVTKLLALLTEQLGKSGTLTTNEFLDRAKRDHANISVEVDESKKRQTE